MVVWINTTVMRTIVGAGRLRQRLSEERGQDLLEYALLGGLLAAAVTAATLAVIMTGALDAMATGIGACIDFDSSTPCP